MTALAASEEARSKREAQTAAAWSFCDEMVRKGYMKQHELPPKQNPLVSPGAGAGNGATPTTIADKKDGAAAGNSTAADNAEFGGWTIDNARQRLNRFCMSERISCDFENIVEGKSQQGILFFVCLLIFYKKKLVNRTRPRDENDNFQAATGGETSRASPRGGDARVQ